MTGAELSELKTALDLYASQYGATDKLWTYFSSITLAVLGSLSPATRSENR